MLYRVFIPFIFIEPIVSIFFILKDPLKNPKSRELALFPFSEIVVTGNLSNKGKHF